MKYFDTYTSNTLAGSSNQSFFVSDDKDKVYKSRTLYRVFCGGEFNYSLLFSNIIDSTYSDGKHSHNNLIIDTWTIVDASIGISKYCSADAMDEPYVTKPLLFNGSESKEVNPGELFCSDPVLLAPESGEFICVEISFMGDRIPYHEESIIPSFVLSENKWMPSKKHPFAQMLGCDRPVKSRIAFLGDSITQGIGTEVNSYKHWNALVAENIGRDYAYWNLGIGYGRADDAASDGAWLYKAKQNDIVVVCFGVNDILQGFAVEKVKANLAKIVGVLRGCDIRVVLQTLPPFDYEADKIGMWNEINRYIKQELRHQVEFVFDCAEYLKKSDDEPHLAAYGGHPNEVGCKIWGDKFSPILKEIL